jgi:hypothetical protein
VNTHKNPPSFWGLDDPVAVMNNIAPLCPITSCTSCKDCVMRHQCERSEYPDKDPNKTFVLVKGADGASRWKEVPYEDAQVD